MGTSVISADLPFSIENPKTWTVLVVDDENDNIVVAELVLSHIGVRVFTASNGRLALNQLETITPSLILLDLSMPVMDGWETIKHLKSDPRWHTIPVIAVTAHAMFGDRNTTLEAGFDGYINKPIRVLTFVSEIQRLLQTLSKNALIE